jgi:transposase-like protein
MTLPFKTLPDLLQYFNSEEKARTFLEKVRWPSGNIECPLCGTKNAYRNGDCKTYKCKSLKCKTSFSVTVGTMMENTKLPLAKWFAAMWLITNHKKGISSCQLARDLGIGQKAAWFLNHRIREMVIDKAPDLLNDVVAVDEAHIGGRWANMSKDKRTKLHESGKDNKTPVMGMVQKQGKAKLFVIGNSLLKERVRQHISTEAIIVTDEQQGYTGLVNEYKNHVTINHSMLEFKKDGYSTNAVEGFFSHFKRMVIGTYHQLSVKHLDRYCQEHAYRYNTRKVKDNLRFMDVISKVDGRLTYEQLIGRAVKRNKVTL